MSLKHSKKDANLGSNLMTEHGMNITNYTRNGPNTFLDSSKTSYVVHIVGYPR
jgi:hypothetical protein